MVGRPISVLSGFVSGACLALCLAAPTVPYGPVSKVPTAPVLVAELPAAFTDSALAETPKDVTTVPSILDTPKPTTKTTAVIRLASAPSLKPVRPVPPSATEIAPRTPRRAAHLEPSRRAVPIPDVPRTQNGPKRGPLGSVELRFADVDAIGDFASVRHALASDMSALADCDAAACSPQLRALSRRLSAHSPSTLAALNGELNRIPYRDDAENWARSDHWARPSDMLARGGDCEDYALLKFAALATIGVKPERMRLVIGHTRSGVPHVVLSLETQGGTVILDNRVDAPLRVAEADIVPRYSVNLDARWTHAKPRRLLYAEANTARL